jgi:hypothetical protein
VEISTIIKEVSDVADEYDLLLVERDRTDNTIDLTLVDR